MPRPGPPLPLVALRMTPADLAVIDDLAREEGVTRSELMRQLLREAVDARVAAGTP